LLKLLHAIRNAGSLTLNGPLYRDLNDAGLLKRSKFSFQKIIALWSTAQST
ncbi:hypothetical protein Tsubulata_046431, partial [Turnera subulata]